MAAAATLLGGPTVLGRGHHRRYPKHDGDKGTVFGGECNRTACKEHGATYWNAATYGYYCAEDAERINWNKREFPLCVQVDHDLTIDEMDDRERADRAARRGART